MIIPDFAAVGKEVRKMEEVGLEVVGNYSDEGRCSVEVVEVDNPD